MIQFSRHVQKFAILVVFLLCVRVYYFHQSSSISYLQRGVSQSVSDKHGSKVSQRYSIKPIVYIFPQYYVFEDNNRLHGENFTEWVNVKRVTHNSFGLETIRPHESIGFYNGLEFQTRQRQGRFLRDHGFHGAVFHHYWFAGRPVMEHIIQAMLKDGEPNIPFMLSWANEPWSARWDSSGGKGKLLIDQEYGLQVAWRKHFDWLLPFFRHPQYIRSDGKVQFVVYNPTHMGHIGPQMFAAWRQWAIEEGLGGIDIIETRWGEGSSNGPAAWVGNPPDAVNEFAPHAGGRDQARFPALKKLSRVYHRGTLACWDTTPRHPTDGLAVCLPTCHPRTWQNHLVEMFRTIKAEPNPIGSENLLFVNALNEWGEGNSIEPSAQFGDGYGIAMRNAIEISKKEHAWADSSIGMDLTRDAEITKIIESTADVCVLVHTSPTNADGHIFQLSTILRSLKAQRNNNWRATVFQTDGIEFPDLGRLITQTLDARVTHIRIPKDIATPAIAGENVGHLATDWLIKNLNGSNPGCASARYLLVTDGSNTYEPTAFDSLSNSQDLIGLNVESRQHIWDHSQLTTQPWNSRCTWLENLDESKLCSASAPTLASFDTTATFFNLAKLKAEGHSFRQFNQNFPQQQDGALAEYLTSKYKWTIATPQSSECHVRHNPAYTSCLKTGNFWFDSPLFEEMGCYSTTSFLHLMEKKSPDLKWIDLQYFREHGYCVRYKEAPYSEMLKST